MSIGYCEICGLPDHHLEEGICARCDSLCIRVGGDDQEVAIGAESDARHVDGIHHAKSDRARSRA